MKTKISITMDQDTLRKVDRERDLVNRSVYIEHLVKLGLDKVKGKTEERRRRFE